MSPINYIAPTDLTIKHITFNGDSMLYNVLKTINTNKRMLTKTVADITVIGSNGVTYATTNVPNGKKSLVWNVNVNIAKEETWNIEIPNIDMSVLVEVWFTLINDI